MDRQFIINELTAERDRISRAILVLKGLPLGPGRHKGNGNYESTPEPALPRARRTLSAAARRKIARAAKKRWAKAKAAGRNTL